MAGDRKAPKRNSPLDGLSPTDFVRNRNWPHGPMVVPKAVVEYGLTREQARHLMRGIDELRQLVLDYETYLKGRGTTQAAVAKLLGLNANRLSAMRTGTGWPSFRTYATLRAFIPSEEQMKRGDFREDGTGS